MQISEWAKKELEIARPWRTHPGEAKIIKAVEEFVELLDLVEGGDDRSLFAGRTVAIVAARRLRRHAMAHEQEGAVNISENLQQLLMVFSEPEVAIDTETRLACLYPDILDPARDLFLELDVSTQYVFDKVFPNLILLSQGAPLSIPTTDLSEWDPAEDGVLVNNRYFVDAAHPSAIVSLDGGGSFTVAIDGHYDIVPPIPCAVRV